MPEMLRKIIYVSQSKIRDSDRKSAVGEIIRVSDRNNARDRIGGALLFTGFRFAQCLEGPSDAVDRLMDRIALDERHENVEVLLTSLTAARSFEGWGMAYQGESMYVDRRVKAMMGVADPYAKPRMIEDLEHLIRQLAL